MVEKPKHVAAGLDPFTYKKNEKKLEQEKQKLRELKNKISTSGPAGSGGSNASNKADPQILNKPLDSAESKTEPSLKQR